MANRRYRTVQVNISDAEFARVKKRLIDDGKPLAELMAELLRDWLARKSQRRVGESESENNLASAT